MYPANHFKITLDDRESQPEESDYRRLIEIIIDNPLATLLVEGEHCFNHVSYIPIHFDENQKLLLGHVSNHHPLAMQLKSCSSVGICLLFHGEHGYVSPNYVSEQYSKEQRVPTWNYCNVQVLGKAKMIIDKQDKYQHMHETTNYFEQTQQSPWQLDSAPNKMIEQMLNAITLFSIEIGQIEGRFKLSQNKSFEVKQQIAKRLQLQGKHELSKQMLT